MQAEFFGSILIDTESGHSSWNQNINRVEQNQFLAIQRDKFGIVVVREGWGSRHPLGKLVRVSSFLSFSSIEDNLLI